VIRVKAETTPAGFIWPILALTFLFVLSGCSGSGQFVAPPSLPDDRQRIPEPKVRKYNNIKDGFNKQFTLQMEQSLEFSRQLRHLTGSPKQALNVDAFDEVPNSSWFTNRNSERRMALDEMAQGPNTGGGPDTTGEWIVTRAKAEGVTPGFHIKDGRGDRYLIKFDPLGFSELATGAEVVSTKLFYAAGYHVPENHIAYFHPHILELGDRVKFTDSKGKKRHMRQADLDELLDRIQKLPDGRIRALASKYIPGKPLGPFAYHGFRKDDPNDYIPHQHRRELRGLRVIAAWLNHTDTKSGNSFDSYVTENGNNYVRHYLIDFGSTLGSAAHGPMKPQAGHENSIDPQEILLSIATLGLYVKPWERLPGVKHPSIGRFEATLFDPGGFKNNIPNPAFESCTNRDGFWGAKIVMSFTDEQLERAVEQGQYSDPEAAAYLLQVLKERRDETGRYWYSKINSLDRFELRETSGGRQSLCFADLAVETNLESKEESEYRYDLHAGGKRVVQSRELGANTCIPLPEKGERKLRLERFGGCSANDLQWQIRIQTRRGSNGKWSKWVEVYLSLDESLGEFLLLGIRRQE
jgi:hypothetical protein